jgi:hypothetical protein
MLLPACLAIALGGFCSYAHAQAQCPEFVRLHDAARDAQRPTVNGRIPGSCGAYVRSAQAWRALVEYADEYRVVCDISERSRDEFEKYRREAATRRDNVCAGRPARPFPPDIIKR